MLLINWTKATDNCIVQCKSLLLVSFASINGGFLVATIVLFFFLTLQIYFSFLTVHVVVMGSTLFFISLYVFGTVITLATKREDLYPAARAITIFLHLTLQETVN
jgi:hypothetical protein